MIAKPKLIEGEIFSDIRGALSSVNNFEAVDIKRFYVITHPDVDVIRGWHLHLLQKRWFYCVAGEFDVRTAAITDAQAPEKNPVVERYLLSTSKSQILEIPEGNAHGFRALQSNSKLLVFSNCDLNTFKEDHYRYPAEQWTAWHE